MCIINTEFFFGFHFRFAATKAFILKVRMKKRLLCSFNSFEHFSHYIFDIITSLGRNENKFSLRSSLVIIKNKTKYYGLSPESPFLWFKKRSSSTQFFGGCTEMVGKKNCVGELLPKWITKIFPTLVRVLVLCGGFHGEAQQSVRKVASIHLSPNLH